MKCCVAIQRGSKPVMLFTVNNVINERHACTEVLEMSIFDIDDVELVVSAINVASEGLPVETYTMRVHRKSKEN